MKKNPDRVTITTLAADLGLSVCTINKALTGKPRISDETRARVKEAAARLGYEPNRLARTLVRPVLNIGVIRPDAWPTHMELLVLGVREKLNELRDHRVTGDFRRVRGFSNSAGFLREIESLAAAGANGFIVILGNYTETERSLIWKTLKATGAPYVLLGDTTDESGALTCINHNCHRCGRMAGELLASMVGSSPIGIFVGHRDVPDHRDKISGFQAEASRQGLTVSGIGEAFDDPDKAYPAAAELFKRHPETAGIYIASENSPGILQYLRDNKIATKVRVVATGNSAGIIQAIEQRVVQASLYQNQPEQGRRAVEALFRNLETGERPPEHVLVAPAVMLHNNIDLWPKTEK